MLYIYKLVPTSSHSHGVEPTVIVLITWFLVVSMTDTVPSSRLLTYTFVFVAVEVVGHAPTGISTFGSEICVAMRSPVSIMVTLLFFELLI